MVQNIQKVATIQDLSGYGRCALTVAIPVLSVMGIQVCPVPTAVLSTHMGGFGKPEFYDLTSMIDNYLGHWRALNLDFDALYSGFLANEMQIDQVIALFKDFNKTTQFKLVDPVMGDKGKLYSAYTKAMQKRMGELVAVADIVTPNLTELYFLLGKDYTDRPLTEEEAVRYVKQVSTLGPTQVVAKGILLQSGYSANVVYDKSINQHWILPYDAIEAHYPGTGDIFASVLVGSLLKGEAIVNGVERAAVFVRKCVEVTKEADTDPRAGVLLEGVLDQLVGCSK